MAANNTRIVRFNWDNFESNFTSEFGPFFQNCHLSDVSIGTEDGRKIRSHKVVLSIGSGYFRKIFEMDSTSSFVFLPGIDSKIVKFVLYFMYHGSVNIPNKDLNAFGKAAGFLRLNGFEESNSNDSKCLNVVAHDGVNQSDDISPRRKCRKMQSKGNGSRADQKRQSKKLKSNIYENWKCDNKIDSISLISSDEELFGSSSTSKSNHEDHGSESDSSIDLIN